VGNLGDEKEDQKPPSRPTESSDLTCAILDNRGPKL
jgi:hypothetical protein